MALSEWTKIFLEESDGVLHGDAWNLEFSSSIGGTQIQQGWQYNWNTSAWFHCSQCRRGWPSNKVMVLFHMRLLDGVGHVKVRLFRQRCKKCTEAKMVDPEIAPENIANLLRNLVKKIRIKCYHEDLGPVDYQSKQVVVKSPHEPDHCEACLLGICKQESAESRKSHAVPSP